MATPNAIAVALFNAAAGAYTGQIASDPNSMANAAGLILQKDISNDALYVEHLLGNFGVTPSNPIYLEAKNALTGLVQTQGRGQAAVAAIDFLKSQEAAANPYALVALNFAVKVASATMYSSSNPNERDITKLVSGVTGVDTDQVAISDALAAINPAFSASLQAALAAADAKAQADKVAAVAAQKALSDAAIKSATDKAAADLKAAQDKAFADAAAAKATLDKVVADDAAALKAANALAAEAAVKAAADKAAAAAAVDKTSDNAAAITAYLKATAATLGLTGYETMTDLQLVNIIKYSDNQAVAAAVDKSTDNPSAITNFLKSTASDLGVSGTASMSNSQLINAIKTVNDSAVAAAQKSIDDGLASIAAQKALSDAAALKVITDAAAAQAVIDRANAVEAQRLLDVEAARLLKVTTDAALAAAQSNYQTALQEVQRLTNLSGLTQSLTTGNDTVLAVSSGNDTISATNLTYGTDDLIVDTSILDLDVLVLSVDNADIATTPVVVGFENINVNVTSQYAGITLPTVFSFNADNLRKSTLNFDVTNVNSVVTDLVVTNLPLGVAVNSSNEFTTVSLSADDNAIVNYTGQATSLTIDSPSTAMVTDVVATVTTTSAGTFTTDSDAVVRFTASADTNVTASNAVTLTVTSAGQATISANAADTVSVTATEEALVTANSAETVNFVTGDGIDSTSSSAIDSTLTSSNANNIQVNISGRSSATVVDVSGAVNVNSVAVTGSQNVTIKVGLAGIDGLGTSTTSDTTDDNLFIVSNANTGSTTLWIKSNGGDADFSRANVNSIVVGTAMASADDLTLANTGALVVVAVDQTSDLELIAKNAATKTTNSVNVAIKDNGAANVDGDLAFGLKLTSFGTATLTNNDINAASSIGAISATDTTVFNIASGTQGFTETSTIALASTGILNVSGSGAVNLGSAVTASEVVGTSSFGAITIGLTGASTVGKVTTGLGADVLSISSAVRSSGSYVLATNAGADSLTISLAQDFSWNGGADNDSLKIVGDLNLRSKTVTLTDVNAIYLDTGSTTTSATLTINPATLAGNLAFNLIGTVGGVDTLLVDGGTTVTNDVINGGSIAVEENYAVLSLSGGPGNDTITGSTAADILNGGLGNDSLTGGSGGDTYIFNTGDVDAGETIVESDTGSGTDTVYVQTTTDFTNMAASSFDNIEAITFAASQSATFVGAQLTGEVIALTGTASEEIVTVNVEAGSTFASYLTNAAANINKISYLAPTTGTTQESITGGAMNEVIRGYLGDDFLAGGGGTDTYIFEATNNGLDRITFGVVDGSTVDDKLDFTNCSITGAANMGYITEDKTATTLTSNAIGDNIMILQAAYYADAAALNLSTMLFAASYSGIAKVLFLYSSSDSTDVRVATATISDAGNVSGAVDVAVLVGLTLSEAVSGLGTGNFVLS